MRIRCVAWGATWLLAASCSFDGSTPLGAPASIDANNGADANVDPSNVGLGNGSDGELIVNTGNATINESTAVTAGALAGETLVTVDDSSIVTSGDVIIVWQTTRQLTFVSGEQSPVSLSALGVGHYELHRVQNVVDSSTIQIEAPLANLYVTPGAQVVRVPQFSDVTIEVNNAITPQNWNGERGGLLAFLTSGTLTLGGNLLGSARGFRGGRTVQSPGNVGCAALDQAPPDGGERGESLAFGSWGEMATGYGNQLAGGGGGNCSDAGGGGGGHAGVGGNGGQSWQNDGNRDVGGRGGASLNYSMSTHMSMGAGGGAGHSNSPNETNNGARGGAAIWIGAERIVGAGFILSNGGRGGDSIASNGGGGGGSGGYVRIQASTITCAAVRANGGDGGNINTNEGHGPGAGGSPGRLQVLSNEITCRENQVYGQSGALANGDHWGATPACGDGSLFGDEQCDDGNLSDGDGCNSTCVTE